MKICFACKVDKSINDFYNNKSTKDGKYAYCIGCSNTKSNEWHLKNPEQTRRWDKNKVAKRKLHNRIDGTLKEHKFCPSCKTLKSAPEFGTNSNTCHGLQTYCQQCCAYRSTRNKDKKHHRKTCSLQEFLYIINNLCYYCGYAGRVGADRIDNSKGHEVDNILPCCYECNIARSNRFTVEEMKNEIGPAIRRVRESRERKR